MTTKVKIISGFTIMVIIMAGAALQGYLGLEQASGRFLTYRQYAGINVYSSDIMTNLGLAGTNINAYLLNRDPKALEACMQAMENMNKVFETALKETQDPENQKILEELKKISAEYKAGLVKLVSAVGNLQEQYNSVVTPNGMAMAGLLHDLANNAKLNNNLLALADVEELWGQFAMMLSALGRFGYSRTDADIKAVESRIGQMRPLLQRTAERLATMEGRATFDKLDAAATAVFGSVAEMKQNAQAANRLVTSLASIRAQFSRDLGLFSNNMDERMRDMGQQTIDGNAIGQRNLLLMSVVGVTLGIFLAIFIIVGIVRVLKELSSFAAAISNGDFSHQIKSREKGEIGVMVTAMKSIPEVIRRVISDISDDVGMLRAGHYRVRLNARDYPGAFGDLADSINAVAEAYTKTLDELPVPILTADRNLTTHFSNTASQESLGGRLADSFVQEGNAAGYSFGKKAMEKMQTCSAETKINNRGNDMYLKVIAVPLISDEKCVGFLEILTDLTEIRTQQQRMLQVAGEAAEISNRVAAASEELAAQVEQISRGAGVQRERIESTASAMTEMNATVLEVARSAGEASEQSESTRAKAEEGAGLVNRVMTAIDSVNSVGQNLQTNMRELGNQAESIGSVMNVISDIADQTNLLALNAAIEAARAGEAGRGFAVVADEVRKLAEKTMAATQEVGASINAVQQSARANVTEVEKAVASVVEANKLADSSGEALAEIVNLASTNSSVVASIATAAEEQSATSEEINHAIDEINKIVGETTEGMIQSSAAVQDLSRMAQELRRVMEGLK